MEAMGVAATPIAQSSAAGVQGRMSNLQRFMEHHPSIFTRGEDPVVVDH